MVAKIKFGSLTADLGDDGIWYSSDPLLAISLNALYSPKQYPPSPADGVSYAAQARAAAEQTGAELEWGFQPLVTEERVY